MVRVSTGELSLGWPAPGAETLGEPAAAVEELVPTTIEDWLEPTVGTPVLSNVVVLK